MNCEQVTVATPDFLAGSLAPAKTDAMQAHMATCGPCGTELESLSLVWNGMESWADQEPSAALRTRVFRMLEAFDDGREATATPKQPWWQRFFSGPIVWQVIAAAALVAVGFWLGGRDDNRGQPILLDQPPNLTANHARPPMARQVSLALLRNTSPTDRLSTLQNTSQLDVLDADLLDALLLTLNQDPNVNVRLSALDVLYRYLDHPEVREGIVRAMPNQDSPLVQVALVDCLVATGEARAAATLRELLLEPDLNVAVRAKAQAGISVLQ